ncbi:MAG: sensor histidine kinase, partial [Firmicutes bacterium]|nr:sensor histidine kinase [Bacillota bacterium]
DMWIKHYRLAAEFLAFFLCVAFMAFCIVYYQEYEKKSQIQRKNQIIEITVQQQAKEIESIRKSNLETSLLRHDLRHLLSTLATSIEQNDKENALNLISGYVAQVESAALRRYCQNDTLNYILSNFESKCRKSNVAFHVDLQLETLSVDEVMFTSIISNALDNALNAQMDLPPAERQIRFMLKHSNGKLLFSVKNPYNASLHPLTWINQLPASTQKGHGYGTQSILYLTEKLGGKCQFIAENNMFVLRVII